MPNLKTEQQHIELAKSGIRLASIWKGMVRRCTDINYPHYPRYGGRGISVEWETFDDFLADMLPSHDKNKSLDRIDNNGNYSLKNCRWATSKEQANNTSRNRKLSFNGLELTLGQWGERIGVHSSALRNRLDLYGWSLEKTLTTPIYSRTVIGSCKRNHIRTDTNTYINPRGFSVCRDCISLKRKQIKEAQIA